MNSKLLLLLFIIRFLYLKVLKLNFNIIANFNLFFNIHLLNKKCKIIKYEKNKLVKI
jgi:hypothetical protein